LAKKQKKGEDLNSILSEMQQNILDISDDGKKDIPDIITFCEGEDWLALPYGSNPIKLYPVQKLILKVFYRGTIGNKNITLTEQEIKLCEKLGLVDKEKGDVLGKYNNKTIFDQLVLVWGRRASKDFLVSLIATYESMKLLECEGGDPYVLYELSPANTINILTIANSTSQAGLAFTEIKSRILNSPYFADKFIQEGLTASAFYLLTPKDKEDNKYFKSKKMPIKKGSVGIIVGHSNSDSLLGQGCIVLILDEVATYKQTGGASSGDRIYAALTPTLSTYCRKTYKTDENGDFILDENGQRVITHRQYDGKTISISSPRGKEGKFYNLFTTADESPKRLACRLPTWEVNPTHTRESLRLQHIDMTDEEFMMEFGAEFSGTAGQNFFIADYVDMCFDNSLENVSSGTRGNKYFAHLDPATSSHNYALVIVHREYYINQDTKKMDYVIVVDHMKHWHPLPGKPIQIDEVDNYVVGLKRKFPLAMITYDQWNHQSSVQKLKKAGIPHKLTQFGQRHKCAIYNELEQLVNMGRLIIPYYSLLKSEMCELQRKYTPNAYKVYPMTDGDGSKTDDVVDCLAGACFAAQNYTINQLPKGRLVSSPCGGIEQNITWRSMQGTPYGTGPGQRVAMALEKRSLAYGGR